MAGVGATAQRRQDPVTEGTARTAGPSPPEIPAGERGNTMKKLITGFALVAAVTATSTGIAGATEGKWQRYATNALPHVTALESDMQAVSTAAASTSLAAVEQACTQLGDDVTEGRDALTHSPSKRLNRLMRQALTKFVVASAECVSGDFDSAVVSITEGGTLIQDATSVLETHVS